MKKIVEIIERDIADKIQLPKDQVFDFVLESGISYLQNIHPDDIRDALKSSSEFWLWWRTMWANRDRQLLARIKVRESGFTYYNVPIEQLKNDLAFGEHISFKISMMFYQSFHTPFLDRIDMYPNDEVIKAALEKQEELVIN